MAKARSMGLFRYQPVLNDNNMTAREIVNKLGPADMLVQQTEEACLQPFNTQVMDLDRRDSGGDSGGDSGESIV